MDPLDLGSGTCVTIYLALDPNNVPQFSLSKDGPVGNYLTWEPALDSTTPLTATFDFDPNVISSITAPNDSNITITPPNIMSVATTASGSSGDPFTVNLTNGRTTGEDPIIVVTPQ